jgi:hypothetical protein
VQHGTVESVARFAMYDAKKPPCSAGAGSDGAVVTDSPTASQRRRIALVFGPAAATRIVMVCRPRLQCVPADVPRGR